MVVLITGASGFIGGAIATRLVGRAAVRSLTSHPGKNRFRDAVKSFAYAFDRDEGMADAFRGVDVFVNTYYRVVTPKIPARSQFKAPLDVFVEAYGRRFQFSRTQVHAVRLTATLPGGEPLVLDKAFQLGGLAGALGGKK